ncbi:MAG: glutaminyl-peptide cyclotransferase [Chitinophagaceae bacterium]
MNRTLITLFFLLFIACNTNNNNADNNIEDNNNPAPAIINYNVIKVYPHDTSSYTQGLIWYNNTLYEGTGWEKHSKLMKEDITTGKPLQEVKVPDTTVFGEGIAILNNKIYQLTYTSNKAYVYDLNTFKKINEFNWPYEGWGITNDGKNLIISTGSSNLYFVNPDDFKIEKIVSVNDNYGPVANLNELEYIKGYVYANQYETNYILKINPETGRVEGKMDLTGIREKNGVNPDPQMPNDGFVLNGIAYDSTKNSLYVTGKKWPALFEIKLN